MALSVEWDADDESHPIPFVGRVDAFVTTKEGSTYYGLVISAPMHGDERSQHRLLKKLDSYISDRNSEEAIAKYGKPSPEKSHVRVAVHPGSDAQVFLLLEKCKAWLEDVGFSYEVSCDANVLGLH